MQSDNRERNLLKAAYNVAAGVIEYPLAERNSLAKKLQETWKAEHKGWGVFVRPYAKQIDTIWRAGVNYSWALSLLLPAPGQVEFADKLFTVEQHGHHKRIYILEDHWTNPSNS